MSTTTTPYCEIKSVNFNLNQQEIARNATSLKSRPTVFWFDLHGPCNLECLHCGFRKHGRTSDQGVSDDVYEAVCDEIMPTAQLCHLGGSNWGEMTISPNFGRFVRDCKKYEVAVNLTTNGTRIDDEWLPDLVDVLSVVGFSMEGMEEQFEMMRGFKWRFFLKHVEKMCRAKADSGKQFRIEWRFCAHVDNIHQLPAMIRLGKSIGLDRIQIMNLQPYVKSQEHKKLHYNRSLANSVFAESRKLAQELNFDIVLPPQFDTGKFESELHQIGPLRITPRVDVQEIALKKCYMPWQACSINELGIVKPDAIYWRPAGDLTKTGFEKIWNGSRFRTLRASVNRSPDSICVACRQPSFDSESNLSALQSHPGLRESLQRAFTLKRRHYNFSETDPREQGH